MTWIERAGHLLPDEQSDALVHAVSEFLAEPRRPMTSSSGRTAQNVALEAR